MHGSMAAVCACTRRKEEKKDQNANKVWIEVPRRSAAEAARGSGVVERKEATLSQRLDTRI